MTRSTDETGGINGAETMNKLWEKDAHGLHFRFWTHDMDETSTCPNHPTQDRWAEHMIGQCAMLCAQGAHNLGYRYPKITMCGSMGPSCRIVEVCLFMSILGQFWKGLSSLYGNWISVQKWHSPNLSCHIVPSAVTVFSHIGKRRSCFQRNFESCEKKKLHRGR